MLEESPSHTQQGQIERARRLREHIEKLKSGQPAEEPSQAKSLREQIEERARKVQDSER